MKLINKNILILTYISLIAISHIHSMMIKVNNNRDIDAIAVKDNTQPSNAPSQANQILNKGWSLLNQKNKNPFTDPEKMLTNKSIFKNNIDFKKKQYDKAVYAGTTYHVSTNKSSRYYNDNESKKLMSQVVIGNYIPPNKSWVNSYANKFIKEKYYLSQVFTDNYYTTTIAQNRLINFPRLNANFLKDAITIFGSAPSAASNTDNPTSDDLTSNIDLLKRVLGFFKEYGTHYVNKAYLGFRSGFTNEQPSTEAGSNLSEDSEKVKNEGSTKSDSKVDITTKPYGDFEAGPNKSSPSSFNIGSCSTSEMFRVKEDSCDINNPRLIKMEIEPLHQIFSKQSRTINNFIDANGNKVSKDNLKIIYNSMKGAIEKVQDAVRPDNIVIVNIQGLKDSTSEPSQACLNKEQVDQIHERNFKFFSRINQKYNYTQQYSIWNKNYSPPVIYNFGSMSGNKHAAEYNGQGLYLCLRKDFNLDTEKPTELQTTYYTDIRFLVDDDTSIFKDAGYECSFKWDFDDKDSKFTKDKGGKTAKKGWNLCFKPTKNPLDPNIVKDVKFFEFDSDQYKCSDGKLDAFNDGMSYKCDCDLDFSLISDEASTDKDRFLCLHKKSDNFMNLEGEPNRPMAKTRKVKYLINAKQKEAEALGLDVNSDNNQNNNNQDNKSSDSNKSNPQLQSAQRHTMNLLKKNKKLFMKKKKK